METVLEKLIRVVKFFSTEKRFAHMSRVAEWTSKIAESHGLQDERLIVAAFSHDMFRDLDEATLLKLAKFYGIDVDRYRFSRPILLHGPVAAEYMKRRFGIDSEVFEAIYYHTSGVPGMRPLGKILVIADVVEQSRVFPKAEELRQLALNGSLDEAYRAVIKQKVLYALEKELLILPETMEAWNDMVERSDGSGKA